MAIKRVVDKPKTQVIKKSFPEFDSSKLYVAEQKYGDKVTKLTYNGDYYGWDSFDEGTCMGISSDNFRDAIIKKEKPVYILDNQQDLARFIMGCREFTIVEKEEIKEEVVGKLADDEVSVEDVALYKIYAANFNGYIGKFHINNSNKKAQIVKCHDSDGSGLGESYNIEDQILSAIKNNYEIYQFDTQEEFLRWSLEQVTGKNFKTISGASIGRDKVEAFL